MKTLFGMHRFGIFLAALGLVLAAPVIAEAQNAQQPRKGLHDQMQRECSSWDAPRYCDTLKGKRSAAEMRGQPQPRRLQPMERRQARQAPPPPRYLDQQPNQQPRRLEQRPAQPRYQPHVERQRPSHRYLNGKNAERRIQREQARRHARMSPQETYRWERCQARYAGMSELRPGDSLRKTLCMLGRKGTRQALHKRYPGHTEYYTMKYTFAEPRVFGYGSGGHHRNISTIWIVFDSRDRIVRFLNTPYDDWHHHHHHTHGNDHDHHGRHDHGHFDDHAVYDQPSRTRVTFSWVWIDW